MNLKKQKQAIRRFVIGILPEIAKVNFWQRCKFCFFRDKTRLKIMRNVLVNIVKDQSLISYDEIMTEYDNQRNLGRTSKEN